MKMFIISLVALCSLTAFAGERSPSEAIERIEAENNVRCDLVKNSFSICIGMPREAATCRYTKTYNCYGAEALKVKMKVKDFYNYNTDSRETVVTKIEIK